MRFILNNIQWIFSGIGVFILGFFVTRKIIQGKKVNQKIGNNSTGIQVGRDVNIGAKNDSSESR